MGGLPEREQDEKDGSKSRRGQRGIGKQWQKGRWRSRRKDVKQDRGKDNVAQMAKKADGQCKRIGKKRKKAV